MGMGVMEMHVTIRLNFWPELRTKNYNSIAWSVYGYSCIMNFYDTVTELQSSRDISRS